MDMYELLKYANESGVSDLFAGANKVPAFRINGAVFPGEGDIIQQSDIDSFRGEILTEEEEEQYQLKGSAEAAFNFETGERFRLSFYTTVYGPAMTARPVMSGNDLIFENLALPAELGEFAIMPHGMIIVTGPDGGGKSTTLGALVNFVNTNRNVHIVTLESPVEFVHQDQNAVVSQRELLPGESWSDAIASALNESPDCIMIGEMNDLETFRAALAASLSGHLVLAATRAPDVVQALERMVKRFPESERPQIAADLSESLLCTVAQTLVPRADGAGRVAAVEFLRNSIGARKLLADQDFDAMRELLARGTGGNCTFTKSLLYLYKEGFVTAEEAELHCPDPEDLKRLINGMDDSAEKMYGTPEDAMESDAIDLKKLLKTAVKVGASDLHLSVTALPMMRVHGELRPLNLPRLKKEDTERLLYGVLTPRQRLDFETKKELDFALAVELDTLDANGNPEICRFRMNSYFQRGYVGIVARVITSKIPSPEKLNLPESIINLCEKSQGLILVTGPTGSGKSTTLASLIDRVNSTRAEHIITIEDPIEYVHSNKKSLIQQRELGADTLSFTAALKGALRQDPDVILVGEMRDTETIQAALTAAETGHLVMATLHTNSAPQTIDRIIDTFPEGQQNQIRLQLSSVIIGIISQRLLARLDGEGRVAAFEILIGTPPVQALVRDGKTSQLPSVLETGFKDGMITMRRSLENLVEQGIVDPAEAGTLSLEAVEVESFQ